MTSEATKEVHQCPVCSSDIKEPRYHSERGPSVVSYSCPRCGDFDLQYNFSHQVPDILNNNAHKIGALSHWIRRKHDAKPPRVFCGAEERIVIDRPLLESIIKQPLPVPAEQADNFIRWLGDNIEAAGETVRVEFGKYQAIIGAPTPKGFHFVFSHLIKEGLIEAAIENKGNSSFDTVTLTFSGWEYYAKLKRRTVDSHKAFMAMQYGREELDRVVEEIFKPAVKQTGFDLVRLNEAPKPAGLIDDRLRLEIQTSRFLIADLTHENRGAYWEAGYAEGLGKPVIYTCEKQKFKRLKTHFDTNHHLTVVWDSKNIQNAAGELKATIRATLPDQAKLSDD